MCVKTLEELGETSPECLLHPSTPLNAPFHSPLPIDTEEDLLRILLTQQNDELQCLNEHCNDSRLPIAASNKNILKYFVLLHDSVTLVFGWWTFVDLQLTRDHRVGKVSAMGQPTRPAQPSIHSGCVNE